MDQLIELGPLQGLPQPVIWFLLVWIFMFGACVGSFMNVVIYRLPVGMSIVHPASRCPSCGHAIRAWDNVPVLGWLILRGRCRDCQTRISARYPAVEAVVGMTFVCLALVVPLSGGRSLPVEQPIPDRLMWALFAGDLVLLSTLICAALIEVDRQPIPLSLFLPALIVSLVVRTYWSEYRGWPAAGAMDSAGWLDGLRGGISVMLASAGLGLPRVFECRPVRLKHQVRVTVLALAATGPLLNLAMVVLIALGTSLLCLSASIIRTVTRSNRASGWFSYQAMVTAAVIIGWNWMADQVSAIDRSDYTLVMVGGILLSVISYLSGSIGRAAGKPPSEPTVSSCSL